MFHLGIAYNKASSIITNMIPISSWYHNDRVMTVFCAFGAIMVPILAIFAKPLSLSHDTQFNDTQPINQNCANQLLELSELKIINFRT
jgi:hypothetical protein